MLCLKIRCLSGYVIRRLGGGEAEIEKRTFLGLRRRKILRSMFDHDGGMLVAALTDGVFVNGMPLPTGTAMVAIPGEKVVLPGKAYFFVS